MMTTETTIQTLAAEALDYFEYSGDNPTGNIRSNIYTRRDDAPGWVSDLVYDAHGDMLPDDYRYRFIYDSLEALAHNDDADDARDELETDVYNRNLLEWLSSHLSRAGYVDQAVEDYGYPGNLFNALQMGQQAEMEEVFDLVLSSLEERLEDVSDDDE